jgi:hypothetical protein
MFFSALMLLPNMAYAQYDILADPPKSGDKAQSEDVAAITAEEVIANYREKVSITRPRCPERTTPDEIIVCAEDNDQYRVPPDTTGRLAEGGPPPAPDVAGPGIFKGPATIGGLCFIPPCPKPPAYFIDYSTLPEFDAEYAAKARAAAAEEKERQKAEENDYESPD